MKKRKISLQAGCVNISFAFFTEGDLVFHASLLYGRRVSTFLFRHLTHALFLPSKQTLYFPQ